MPSRHPPLPPPLPLQAVASLESEVQDAINETFFASRLLSDVAATVPAVTTSGAALVRTKSGTDASCALPASIIPDVEAIMKGLPAFASEEDSETARAHVHSCVEAVR